MVVAGQRRCDAGMGIDRQTRSLGMDRSLWRCVLRRCRGPLGVREFAMPACGNRGPLPRGAPQRLCMLVGEAPDLGGGHGQAVIEGKRSAAGSTVSNLHLNATHQ